MFENEWVYLDKQQLESLTGIRVGYGTGALVMDSFDDSGKVRVFGMITLNADRSYVYQAFKCDAGKPGTYLGQDILTREDCCVRGWVSEDMLDRLDPYKQRIEFPCDGGSLFAEFAGDPGIYDGIVTVFKRRADGGEVQCSITETITDANNVYGDERHQLRVAVWDYSDGDDDETASFVIDKETDMAVLPA